MIKNKVTDFIEKNWDNCIKENKTDEGTLIGLPYPYTVPAVGHFDEIYYWDTYFTNLGLVISKRENLAKSNVDNMLYLVDKFGFMPNGNRTYYLDRSQPPFLSLMVADVYKCCKDKEWLSRAYDTLIKEYEFWMVKRITPTWLNTYGHNEYVGTKEEYADHYIKRIGYVPDETIENLANSFICQAESGWDFSPRFDHEPYNYAPVDLNSLMYSFETNMCFFAKELNNGMDMIWEKAAADRKKTMLDLMDNGEGILLDYNFKNNTHSKVLSAASFYPLFAGLAEEKNARALADNLHKLETPYGILTTEKNDIRGNFQWGYPNGWACLQYIAIKGLSNYGYEKESKRIAQSYVKLVEDEFERTGNLWEKYNVCEGNINVTNEYDMPAMMGWTAGVYLSAVKYINED